MYQRDRQTDGQTDGRTDGRTDTGQQQKPCLRMASRDKNHKYFKQYLNTLKQYFVTENF